MQEGKLKAVIRRKRYTYKAHTSQHIAENPCSESIEELQKLRPCPWNASRFL